MEFDVKVLGQVLLAFAIVMAVICYFLGKRKTNNPLLAAFIGAVFSLVPPVAFIYLAILSLKEDLDTSK